MADPPPAGGASLVVGASRGLGLAVSGGGGGREASAALADPDPASQLALALAARGGGPVLATVRGDVGPPELAAAGVTVVPGVDAATDAGEAALAAALAASGTPLTLLVYNAAHMHKENGLAAFDPGRAGEQVATNAFGFVRAARATRPFLARGARVVLTSSKMGSIARAAAGAPGGAMLGYRMSKAAANAAAAALAADLRPAGVAVLAIHPGTIATDMYAYYHSAEGGGEQRRGQGARGQRGRGDARRRRGRRAARRARGRCE